MPQTAGQHPEGIGGDGINLECKEEKRRDSGFRI